ncbi:MAG TPA: NAD-dependent epimerase/dehydratase family protein [Polyangiaceae bacterium]|jgi:nucleoside-diphosphate-sugar epimerase|nr:NAD-dependent epimerase/dehydratase family protein [Polyangiaceae bacterium]
MSVTRYVFLTGGTGFIGSRVAQHLLNARGRGAWDEVRMLARSDASAEKAQELGATPVKGDLDEEGGAWREVARGAAFVVHCAQPPTWEKHEGLRALQDANLLGSIDDGATERAVFVYGSSFLGAGEGLMDETAEPRPIGLGRLFEAGIAALEARGRGGLDCVVAMPGAVYGRRTWFLEMALDALRKGKPIPMCDPAPRWPYVHIDDCARAITLLLTVDRARLDAAGRRVIIAGGDPVPMDRFVEAVGEAVGRRPLFHRASAEDLRRKLPSLMAAYLTADMPHSGARLRSLGFEPRYPTIEAGLASLNLAEALDP